MDTVKIPGFNAEASVYGTSGYYRTRHAIDSPAQSGSPIYPAAPGQQFPNQKCTCKKCGPNGGDVTGQCAKVCKDKEVFTKGSEPYDFCKKEARPRTPGVISRYVSRDAVAFS